MLHAETAAALGRLVVVAGAEPLDDLDAVLGEVWPRWRVAATTPVGPGEMRLLRHRDGWWAAYYVDAEAMNGVEALVPRRYAGAAGATTGLEPEGPLTRVTWETATQSERLAVLTALVRFTPVAQTIAELAELLAVGHRGWRRTDPEDWLRVGTFAGLLVLVEEESRVFRDRAQVVDFRERVEAGDWGRIRRDARNYQRTHVKRLLGEALLETLVDQLDADETVRTYWQLRNLALANDDDETIAATEALLTEMEHAWCPVCQFASQQVRVIDERGAPGRVWRRYIRLLGAEEENGEDALVRLTETWAEQALNGWPAGQPVGDLAGLKPHFFPEAQAVLGNSSTAVPWVGPTVRRALDVAVAPGLSPVEVVQHLWDGWHVDSHVGSDERNHTVVVSRGGLVGMVRLPSYDPHEYDLPGSAGVWDKKSRSDRLIAVGYAVRSFRVAPASGSHAMPTIGAETAAAVVPVTPARPAKAALPAPKVDRTGRVGWLRRVTRQEGASPAALGGSAPAQSTSADSADTAQAPEPRVIPYVPPEPAAKPPPEPPDGPAALLLLEEEEAKVSRAQFDAELRAALAKVEIEDPDA